MDEELFNLATYSQQRDILWRARHFKTDVSEYVKSNFKQQTMHRIDALVRNLKAVCSDDEVKDLLRWYFE